MSSILDVGITALVKTLRVEWNGAPLPDNAVVAFWHSKMLAGWWLARKNAVALVSQSKDGERLAKILQKWDYALVRGSSSKDGREALERAIALVKDGTVSRLVITPDGPRGPKEVMKRGAFIAAKELDVPFIFLEIAYGNAKVLSKSWDKFEVPYPLSKVVVNAIRIDASDFPDDKDSQHTYLEHITSSIHQHG
jgi:lysophospholipid acyltransferase (LPLAT)-like uncharacterized protein